MDPNVDLPDFDDVANMIQTDTDLGKDKQNADPSELQSLCGGKSSDPKRDDAVKKLSSMYGRPVAIVALDAVQSYAPNNVQMAANWIMDHPDVYPSSTKNTKDTRLVPLEVEDGPKTTTTTKKTVPLTTSQIQAAAAADNEDTVDCKQKCDECTAKCGDCCGSTKIFCADCCSNTVDWWGDLDEMAQYGIAGTCACICCIGLILAVILIPLSLRKIEFDEYAIKYSKLTKQEHEEEYDEGRYLFNPHTMLFRYDNLIQDLKLELECLTRDGIVMDIEVDIQYSIPRDNVYDIWDEFGKEDQIDSYISLVAADAIRDAVGIFAAASFYQNRYGIQIEIEDAILDAMEVSNTYLLLDIALLSGYSFPEELKDAIKDKRNAENEIEIANNERDGNLTDAWTDLVVATVYAEQLKIQAQAEVDSLLAEAGAMARAMNAKFEYMQELFIENKDLLNFTASQFLDYWLTAFVLETATKPVTNTVVPDGIVWDTWVAPDVTSVAGNDTFSSTDVWTSQTAAESTSYFTTT